MNIGGDSGLGVSSFLKEIKRVGSKNLSINFQAPVIESLEINGWVRNQNDLQSSGSRGSTPATNGSTLWEFQTQNQRSVQGQPAIAEGYVYHGTGLGSGDISALNKLSLETGNLEWRAEIGGANDIRGTPHIIVASSGAPYIYFSGGDGDVFALDSSDGSEVWSTTGIGANDFSSVLVYNGSLYVGDDSNDRIVSLDADDGSINWTAGLGGSFSEANSPATDGDGSIFIGGDDIFYAFDEGGNQLWSYNISNPQVSPSVDSNGNIYLASSTGVVVSLDNNGKQRWSSDPGNSNPAKAGCIDENNYYIAWSTGHVTSLSKSDGSINFDTQITPDQIFANVTVAQDTLYVGDYNGDFYAVDTSTGNVNWSINVTGEVRGGAATTDGGAIIGTQTSTSGHVYHIE